MKRIAAYLCLLLLPALAAAAQEKTPNRTAVEGLLVDAVSLMDDGRTAEARKDLEFLRGKDPSNDAIHYYLGLCDIRDGKPANARANFEKASQADPDNVWYKEALASACAALGRADDAVALYSELLEKDPKKFSSPYVYTMLGDRELYARRDSAALDLYEKALGMDPYYAPAVLGEAEVYRMRGNLPSFFVNMDRFVRNEGIVPQARAEYLDNLLKHVDGRMFRAWGTQLDSLVDASVKVAPADSSTLKLAGRWFYGTGRKEKGREYFERLLEAYPEDMDAHLIHIQLLGEENRYGDIIDECRSLLPSLKGDDRVRILSVLGDTAYQSGDRNEAYRAYKEALKINPEYVPVLNNYAYYLCLEGRKLRQAAKMSKVTIEKEPDNPTYLDTYGWILHLLGRDAEAKVHFKRAIVYGGSESPVILGHYASVLRALGEDDVAAYYEKQAEKKGK